MIRVNFSIFSTFCAVVTSCLLKLSRSGHQGANCCSGSFFRSPHLLSILVLSTSSLFSADQSKPKFIEQKFVRLKIEEKTIPFEAISKMPLKRKLKNACERKAHNSPSPPSGGGGAALVPDYYGWIHDLIRVARVPRRGVAIFMILFFHNTQEYFVFWREVVQSSDIWCCHLLSSSCKGIVTPAT